MKKQLDSKYLELLAYSGMSGSHFSILMLLMTGSFTQAQIGEKLNIRRQNVNRCIKELESRGFIESDRVEGRNKFLKAVTNAKAIETAQEGMQLKDQLSFDDIPSEKE